MDKHNATISWLAGSVRVLWDKVDGLEKALLSADSQRTTNKPTVISVWEALQGCSLRADAPAFKPAPAMPVAMEEESLILQSCWQSLPPDTCVTCLEPLTGHCYCASARCCRHCSSGSTVGNVNVELGRPREVTSSSQAEAAIGASFGQAGGATSVSKDVLEGEGTRTGESILEELYQCSIFRRWTSEFLIEEGRTSLLPDVELSEHIGKLGETLTELVLETLYPEDVEGLMSDQVVRFLGCASYESLTTNVDEVEKLPGSTSDMTEEQEELFYSWINDTSLMVHDLLDKYRSRLSK